MASRRHNAVRMRRQADELARRRAEIVADLSAIVPGEGVVDTSGRRCGPSRPTG